MREPCSFRAVPRALGWRTVWGRGYANKTSLFRPIGREARLGRGYANEKSYEVASQGTHTPRPRPCSSRWGWSTRSRRYTGALRGRSRSRGKASPPSWDPSQTSDPGVWAGCWSLRPLRDPGFRLPPSQPSGKQTGRGVGALEGYSRVTGQAGRGREITAFLIHEPACPGRDAWVMKGLLPGFLDL